MEALMRHETTAVVKDLETMSTWEEYEVGTVRFWENLNLGILMGHENVGGDYIGVVTDFYKDEDAPNVIWIWVKPDPTKTALPEGQEELPIAFGYRDIIWMETVG
jgi:hypothetical protein